MGAFLIMGPANLRAEGEFIVAGVVDIDQQVWPELGDPEANAALIKMAPEIAASCRELLSLLDDHCATCDCDGSVGLTCPQCRARARLRQAGCWDDPDFVEER